MATSYQGVEERAETIADGLAAAERGQKSWRRQGKLSCYCQKAERRHLNSSTKLKTGGGIVEAAKSEAHFGSRKIKSQRKLKWTRSEIEPGRTPTEVADLHNGYRENISQGSR